MGAADTAEAEGKALGGFGVIDDKGRITLSKALRERLGAQPGSSVALVALDHALVVIPQDERLAEMMERGRQALTSAGLSVRDLLDAAEVARHEVVVETYSAALLEELERMRAALNDAGGAS